MLSNFQLQNIMNRPVPDRGEQDREASMSQRDQSLVMTFALGPVLVVAFPAGRVEQDGRECREEQCLFQALDAGMADAFGFDRGP